MKNFNLRDWCDPDLPFAFTHTHGFSNCPLHKHNFSELVIIFNGKGIHFTHNYESLIETGDVFVVPNNIGHGYKNAETIYLANFMFDLNKLEPMHDLQQLPAFHKLFQVDPALRKEHAFKNKLKLSDKALSNVWSIYIKIQDEMKCKRPGYKTLSKALLLELLTFLSRYGSSSSSVEPRYHHMFDEVIAFLENNFAYTTITLDLLANMCNMSKRNFQRSFKKDMGISPIHYLQKLRINKACKMLAKSKNITITEIGFNVGYTDSNYFSRQFKHFTGMPPKKYRSINSIDDLINEQ